MAAAVWLQKDMRSPSGGEARCRGVTHVRQSSTVAGTAVSRLTRGQVFGEDQSAKTLISPALPDVRPAPQAGCFVSRLQVLLSRRHPATARHPALERGCRQAYPFS